MHAQFFGSLYKLIGEEEQEDIRFMSTGQYGGIGALVGKRKDKLVIIEPYEGYPADQQVSRQEM
ncbi:hypothetical protein D5R40_33710 [Okeania hirsuta]|uniref:Uncharacterized protein n=1 Tax=Okeania hirsuta TaxID=1458930 RepID=A0A3N6NM82_9CYAN|nr:hypothetical protein [Okeania hirsuta]RQH16837.1 hypothetical protein D5R40_33710 [Okeania hirsuta]